MGRPTNPLRYSPVIRTRIFEMASSGLNDVEIALALDISLATFKSWKKREFKDDLELLRKEYFKGFIERGLAKLAEGYSVEEEKEENTEYDKETGIGRTTTKYKKHIPPQIKALQMLSNKYAKGEYDAEIDLSARDINVLNLGDMSLRDLMEYNKKNNPIDKVIDAQVVEKKEVEVEDGD